MTRLTQTEGTSIGASVPSRSSPTSTPRDDPNPDVISQGSGDLAEGPRTRSRKLSSPYSQDSFFEQGIGHPSSSRRRLSPSATALIIPGPSRPQPRSRPISPPRVSPAEGREKSKYPENFTYEDFLQMSPETKGTSYDKMLKERWEIHTKGEGLNKWNNYPVAKFLDNGSAVFSDTYPFRFTEGRKLGRHTVKHKNDFPSPITSKEQYILEVARLHRQPISEETRDLLPQKMAFWPKRKYIDFTRLTNFFR